jgi:hypothetical protein
VKNFNLGEHATEHFISSVFKAMTHRLESTQWPTVGRSRTGAAATTQFQCQLASASFFPPVRNFIRAKQLLIAASTIVKAEFLSSHAMTTTSQAERIPDDTAYFTTRTINLVVEHHAPCNRTLLAFKTQSTGVTTWCSTMANYFQQP